MDIGYSGTIDIFDSDHAMNITILALEGVFDSGLAVVLDALTTANELAVLHNVPIPQFNVSITGVRPQVYSAHRFSVPLTPESAKPALVIVPALGYKLPDQLQQALIRDDVIEALDALRLWANDGVRIAAACIGTFVLAQSGLLNQHEATTTWWLTSLFRQRYPSVQLDTGRMVVNAGQFITSGAALSHLDLVLWLIREISPELAALVASYLVVDSRPSQSTYIISDHLTHTDPLVQQFDRWVREHLDQSFSLDAVSAALMTSKRTLSRHINDATGKTPVQYVQDLRVERAVHILKTTNIPVEEVAYRVGYADGVTLRNLLRRRLGKGVREIRGNL